MRVAIVISLAAATLVACGQASQQQATPTTDEDKTLYSMGALLGENLIPFNLTDEELAMVRAGLTDGAKQDSKLKPEEMQTLIPRINELQTQRMSTAMDAEKAAGAEHLAKVAAESGAEKTDSGIVFKSVKEGTGASPTAEDVVRVHYEGRLVNGKVFDSSRERGEPAEFPLGAVIPCWTEGMQKMKVGGTAQLVCPSDLAYGDRGSPPDMPGGATLVFDVELLDIVQPGAEGAAAAPAPAQ